ncbi:MAG TPA: tripartite tricarboxylate transporter substrate binding protein, partial [Burkholderiales bacterium]|nr:tripartite tricarboxylate transporter substrate binding protein [Burkholderiales bacterium]
MFRSIAWLSILGFAAPAGVLAQPAYPAKPVTLVVSFSTGGSTDIITRLLARELTGQLGKPVLVDNRVGGGGIVGWSSV